MSVQKVGRTGKHYVWVSEWRVTWCRWVAVGWSNVENGSNPVLLSRGQRRFEVKYWVSWMSPNNIDVEVSFV